MSKFRENNYFYKSYFQSVLNKNPMGRLGKPEEVARLFNYLVSEEAGYITGQWLDMSGGRAVYYLSSEK
nr:SDR family oxidoreductase [Psychrobacillus sp. OK032]